MRQKASKVAKTRFCNEEKIIKLQRIENEKNGRDTDLRPRQNRQD